MNYIVTDNEIMFTFNSEFEAYLKYIDLVIYKCTILAELVRDNNELNIPNFITLKLFTTCHSTTVDIIYMDFNDLRFKNFISNVIIKEFNFSKNELSIIEKKLVILRKYKFILDSNIVNQGIFVSQNTNKHLSTYSNDSTSDVASNLNLELASISSEESIIQESDINKNDKVLEDEHAKLELIAQKEKVQKLLEIKKNLEHNKKKKEKIEEMLRRFEVDLEMYLRLKNTSEIPELFKYKYPVFKEIESKNITLTSNDAKKYYIKNFNRINKSIGSNIFTNVFNQREAEEDISNNLIDSDDNKITLSSEEIDMCQSQTI